MRQTVFIAGHLHDMDVITGFGPICEGVGMDYFNLWTKYGAVRVNRHVEASMLQFVKERDAAIQAWENPSI